MDFLVENNNGALKKLSNQEEIPQSQSMLTDILTATERKQKRKMAKMKMGMMILLTTPTTS